MALPKNNRLKKKRDFEAVFKTGKAVNGTFLFAKFKKSPSNVSRFGFVVSSKVAKKAVVRNRIRRALTATVQSGLLPRRQAYDTVVVVTRKADSPDLLRKDLAEVIKRSGIL